MKHGLSLAVTFFNRTMFTLLETDIKVSDDLSRQTDND